MLSSTTCAWQIMVRLVVVWLLALITTGCGGSGGHGDGASPTEDSGPDGRLRIVSLSPALSRTLVDMDLADHMVGRSPFCASVDRSIPVVGDLMSFDAEALVRVRPTHVLIQPPATGVDPMLTRLAEKYNWTVGAWYLHSVDDIEVMLRDLPETLAGSEANLRDRLDDRADRILNEMHDLFDGEDEVPVYRGRTLLIFNTDPVSAFGPGSYPSDILTRLGGTNATTLRDYPQLTLEDVTRIDPEAIVLIREGSDGGDASVPDALGVLGELPIVAARERRLAVLAHPDALAPSSAVVSVARHLRNLLRRLEAGERNIVEEPQP